MGLDDLWPPLLGVGSCQVALAEEMPVAVDRCCQHGVLLRGTDVVVVVIRGGMIRAVADAVCGLLAVEVRVSISPAREETHSVLQQKVCEIAALVVRATETHRLHGLADIAAGLRPVAAVRGADGLLALRHEGLQVRRFTGVREVHGQERHESEEQVLESVHFSSGLV